MTKAEYIKAYREAGKLAGKITVEARKAILQAYKEAAEMAAGQVAITEASGLSDLTSMSWRQIENQLRAGADLVSSQLEKLVPTSISEAYGNYLDVDAQYIGEAAVKAGQDAITGEGVRNLGASVNYQLLQIQATRSFSDGYTFSERIWNLFDPDTGLPIGVNGDYQYRIKNIILSGQAQGRDAVKIAEDIQVYVLKGKEAVFTPGRYGRLVPGTREYARRISRTVDWRALRLVRSEMNASLQQAGIFEGAVNPAALDLYDWVKSAGNPVDIDGSRNASGKRCIDLQREGPYKTEDVPGYQHSNCSCQVVPVLMNQREFVNDLKGWVPGAGPAYLDEWYNTVYLPGNV